MYYPQDYDQCLHLISDTLQNSSKKKYGLLSGGIGIGIFYYFYGLYTKESMDNYIEDEINNSFDILQKSSPYHTLCNGYSGFLYGLDLLNKVTNNNYELDRESKLLLCKYIENKLNVDIDNNNFDLLHGYLGCGLYYLNKNREDIVSKIISKLEETKIQSKQGCIKWASFDTNNKITFNLGLSHGIPGIISFLAKCIEKDFESERCLKLIEGSINYVLGIKKNNEMSFFPHFEGHKYDSRLAWCYGDMGIATTLMLSGNACKRENWKDYSIEIMLKASNKLNLIDSGVMDTCFCHGSSGIGHIFNRFYSITGNMKFKTAQNYWFDRTLDLLHFDGEKAEFKIWHSSEQKWIYDELGILEGIAGIGLSIIYHLRPDIEPKWDQYLLLN